MAIRQKRSNCQVLKSIKSNIFLYIFPFLYKNKTHFSLRNVFCKIIIPPKSFDEEYSQYELVIPHPFQEHIEQLQYKCDDDE
jgi:hypothetical protein